MKKKSYGVGCFVEYGDKFLIMHRQNGDVQGDRYGLVAGSIEKGESEAEAMLRELFEETGYKADINELEFLDKRDWEFPDVIMEFSVFRLKLKKKIKVKLEPKEHTDYLWVTAEECYKRDDLVQGFKELLEKVGF